MHIDNCPFWCLVITTSHFWQKFTIFRIPSFYFSWNQNCPIIIWLGGTTLAFEMPVVSPPQVSYTSWSYT